MTLTVLRSGGVDRHGDRLPGTEHAVHGWKLAPRPGEESSDEGELVIVGLTAFGPFDADIRANDRVRIDDPRWAGTYDVVGEPGRWQNPYTNRRSGVQVALNRTGGGRG